MNKPIKTTKVLIHKDFEFEVNSFLEEKNVNTNKKLLKFMKLAEESANMSDYSPYRLGAVIMKGGKILSRGFNSYKTHPKQMEYNKIRVMNWSMGKEAPSYLHAEMAALLKLKNIDLSDAELFVFRKDKSGKICLARPCAACMFAIKEKNLHKIHYTTPDGIASELLYKEIPTIVKKAKKSI